jgi:ubiquinone/menaquinone biosynthesis C-methylase UbiE
MMIAHARARALASHVEDRVDFAVQDALLLLEFPDGYFDLVNQRNAASFLRIWDWQKMIGECCRVTAQGGIIRLTESDFIVDTSGPVTTYLFELILEAFYRAGHLFLRDTSGITSHLVSILNRYARIRDVSTRMHEITYHAGTPEWASMANGIRLTFQTVVPFLKKWGRLPDNYDTLFQQASHELDQSGATATMRLLTAWGEREV